MQTESVTFSPKADRLASTEGHSWRNPVQRTAIAFSSDGNRLVSDSGITVTIWNALTGACLSNLRNDPTRKDTHITLWDAINGTQMSHSMLPECADIWSLSLSPDNQSLTTEIGIFLLPPSPPIGNEPQTISLEQPGSGYRIGIGINKQWITCNGRNLLWLPPDYRPSSSAVTTKSIVIGCLSGRVWTASFSLSADSLRVTAQHDQRPPKRARLEPGDSSRTTTEDDQRFAKRATLESTVNL